MALATSGTINLTDVRDFYGQSGSINLTSLRRNAGIVPKASTYGSATVGLGGVHGTNAGPGGSSDSYKYGGVVPSLDTEANSSIPESGSISLTDFYGGYRIVNPTMTIVSVTETGNASGFSETGDGSIANYGLGLFNYEGTQAGVSNYGQLVTCAASGYFAFEESKTICTFQVSHTGIYTLRYGCTGNGITFAKVSLSGNVYSGSLNEQTVGLGGFSYNEVGLTSGGNIVLTAHVQGGSAGCYLHTQIRTNCNYLRDVNTTDNTQNNVMLSQN